MTLAPVLIIGDGQIRKLVKGGGLVFCTDYYTIQKTVILMNILIIRYGLICTLRKVYKGQYRIYISERSMYSLRAIVLPFMVNDMLYKLNIDHKSKINRFTLPL